MASLKPLPTFRCFSRLPPELRLEIWRQSLPDLDSITLYNYRRECWGPRDLRKSEVDHQLLDQMPGNTENAVDFDFRHEMLAATHVNLPLAFVNREARSVALAWIQQRGVEMRFDEDRKCHVFEQRFDPRRDALYIGISQWEDFCLEPFDQLAEPDFSSHTVSSDTGLTRIAIPDTPYDTDCSSLIEVFHWFPHLEAIFIVLDLRVDPRIERLLLKGDRKKASALIQQHQWKTEDIQEKTLVWDPENRCFEWKGGAGLGNESLYRRMEKMAREIRGRLVEMNTRSFKIQPVDAV
ncbi:uncharacterized protein TRIVIDRAFT_230606 [Trichoderma virens Gv29-8]|uniref:2EXR domain-containing protein n=1 Tax=Hypocrea virens (strain Gv29-8 / FGSC 10586) TaxID=413071 RepID=G9MR36_HYPVG|nr:uncharacterized protein TRIVIDRAFT_230606 [Trichoderma virens Gv29-8]EHK22563.1 hypothetical protein TRIVIDRAFT_230606 [Trichoderma virens Gv29-8]UKZ47607.1 hypothetical protein TrVGV298_001830 [Trichoderma virens]